MRTSMTAQRNSCTNCVAIRHVPLLCDMPAGLTSGAIWVVSEGQSDRPTRSDIVITAIVMIDCATDSIPEVAQRLADLDGVSEVYSVAGNVDLIAIVRVRAFDEVAEVIAGSISKVEGVLNTETHLAFRAYSRHDLEEAFAIGFD